MEAIILHLKIKNNYPFLKKLFKTMDVPFRNKKEEEIIVGYTAKGIPLTVSEYKEILQPRINDVRNGTAETYTPEQVLKSILNK